MSSAPAARVAAGGAARSGAGARLRAALAEHWPVAVLVLAAVLLRLWMVSVSPLDPRYSNADDGDYYRRALRLAVTGVYVDDSWLIRPPLHVFFFALWLRAALLLGVPQLGVLFVQLAQIGLAALCVPIGYGLARRLFDSRRAGLLLGGFLAAWYPLVEQSTVLFTEQLYLFLFLLHLWLLARYDASGRLRELAGAGLALGAAALTRSPALYAVALVVAWLVVRHWRAGRQAAGERRGWLAPARAALVVVAACLAVVGPWTLRNYLTYGHLIPVDTLGQINLWLDLDKVERRNDNIATLRAMPQSERHLYALARAREILAADPLRPFRPMWDTFRHIWKAQYVEDYFVKQSFFTRPLREAAPLGLLGDLVWLVVVIGGLVGLAGPPREGVHNRLFYLAWVGYSLVTVLVFHVEPRYLLPLWALLALYAAGALAQLGRPAAGGATARRLPWALLRAALVAAFLALFVTYRDYPALIARGAAREAALIAGERAYAAGSYAEAERAFRRALEAQPGFVDGEVRLALSLAAQGRRDEAVALLPRGRSRQSDLVRGALLREQGELEDAARALSRVENTAGEDIQPWALAWLRPPPLASLRLGDGLDLGYIAGFSRAEAGPAGSFRWLEGRGRLVLPLAEPLPADAAVELRLAGGPRDVLLSVRVGDGPTWTIPVQAGSWRLYRIPVPESAAGARSLVVELSAPTFVPALRDPGSDDARALSLMVGGARVP